MAGSSAMGAQAGTARDAIVAAAVACFYERGYDASSVQEVVERAGVTKGAFYHHFSSKDELLSLIHDTFMDVQLDMIERVSATEGNAREKLAELIEQIVIGAERFQPHHAIFFEQRRFLSDERFGAARRKRDAFEKHLVDILDQGIADGEFDAVASTRVLAFGIVGMSAWVYQWYRPGGLSASDTGRLYASVLLDGIALTQPRSSDQDRPILHD